MSDNHVHSSDHHSHSTLPGGLAGLNLGAPLVGVPQSTGTDGQPKGYMSAISNSTDGPHLSQGQHAHTTGSSLSNALHSGENRTGDRYDESRSSNTTGSTLKNAAANVMHSGENRTGDRYDDNTRTGDRYDTTSGSNTTGSTLKNAAANVMHSGNNDRTGDRYDDNSRYESNTTSGSRFNEGAKNSTSGHHGIGGGHGGPTAFEANPEKVGTDRTHDRPDHHTYGNLIDGNNTTSNDRSGSGLNSGLTGSSTTHSDRTGDQHRTGAGAAIADATRRDGSHSSNNYGSNEYDNRSSGSHGLGAGGLAAGGLGAGAIAGAVGSRSHTSPQEGIVGDSVTGQQHFGPGSSGYTGGHASTASHTGQGLTGGVLAGGAGAAATGVSPGTLSSSNQGHSSSHREGGVVGELKQELKDHQKEGGYSDSSKHIETDGPHGLVWHNGKYVHRRELEGKGSTGVPLK